MNTVARTAVLRRVAATSTRGAAAGRAPVASHSEKDKRLSIPDNDILHKGSVQPTFLKPFVAAELAEEDLFGLHELVQIDEMFAARLHYGHKLGTLHPNMKWALYGARLGITLFDLEITRKHLIRALDFVAHVVSRGGIILFLTSNRDSMLAVEKMAEEVGQYSHVRFWQEGTLTNTRQLLGATVRLPDTMVFLSSLTSIGERHPAIVEAAKMAIPTVGIVDSNADPAYLTYLVPANDDSPQAVEYLLRLFKEAVRKGAAERRRVLGE